MRYLVNELAVHCYLGTYKILLPLSTDLAFNVFWQILTIHMGEPCLYYFLYFRCGVDLKVIRKFFLNQSFRWHHGDYEKHNFFPTEGLRGETLIFVCSYGCVVGPVKPRFI